MMNVSRPQVLEYGTRIRAMEDQRLQQRIALLLPADKSLVELVMRGGASHRQIAALMKCTPGNVSRLIRRLGNRLHDPRVAALLHPECPLEPEYRQLGIERFLQGRSIKDLAARHALSAAEVRRRIDLINFWCRGLSAAARRNELLK